MHWRHHGSLVAFGCMSIWLIMFSPVCVKLKPTCKCIIIKWPNNYIDSVFGCGSLRMTCATTSCRMRAKKRKPLGETKAIGIKIIPVKEARQTDSTWSTRERSAQRCRRPLPLTVATVKRRNRLIQVFIH